jgi:hypothetical protein
LILHPNLFNPVTTIDFGIPEKSNVRISIISVIGKDVAVILIAEMEAGNQKVEFNASKFPCGVYFYQLRATAVNGQAGDPSTISFIQMKKMILLR